MFRSNLKLFLKFLNVYYKQKLFKSFFLNVFNSFNPIDSFIKGLFNDFLLKYVFLSNNIVFLNYLSPILIRNFFIRSYPTGSHQIQHSQKTA